MEIDFLRLFGLQIEHISTLKSKYGCTLLSLQEKAIQEGQLLSQENCLICAPTSSGKTLLAEILFLYHAVHARKFILLVPTKALANQRYSELRENYSHLGYDIVLSTRDHPAQDRRILEGRFHLAIIIYEKMRALLAMDDAWLSSMGACVIDEIHYIYHATRGPDLELLLTRLREEKGLQIVGLSAVLSDPQVAAWLRAHLIREKKRPIELRQGVLCQGKFSYKEFNSQAAGVEHFPFSEEMDDGLAMLEAARYFASQGESTLLFWPRRDQCYTAARKLAQEHNPNSDVNLDRVQALEPSSMREFLLELLPRRIAVHTSDLTYAERELVESMAKSGEVKLICATSTLAEGLNFPVVNVLTTQRIYSTRLNEYETYSTPAPMMIQQDQLCNMAGRAGRMGLSSFGRGIIVTCAQGDVEGLLGHFDMPEDNPKEPLLSRISFNQVVLKTIGNRRGATKSQYLQFLENTLTGFKNLWAGSPETRFQQAVDSLLSAQLISQDQDRLYPTPLGELVCKSGLSERSARQMNYYVKEQLLSHPHPLDLLLLISMLDEMQETYVFVSKSQIQGHYWSRMLSNIIQSQKADLSPVSESLLNHPVEMRPEHHRAFRRTLLIYDWMRGRDLLELEQNYSLYSGSITRICEEAGWLIGCMADTAAAHALDLEQVQRLGRLQEQVIHGLPEAGLSWSYWLRRRKLTRREVLKLIEHGLNRPEEIHQEDRAFIESFLSPACVEVLFSEVVQESNAPEPEPEMQPVHEVHFDNGHPNKVYINGNPVQFTKLQMNLLRCLANQYGTCVEYEKIYTTVWPQGTGDRKLLMQLTKKIGQRVSQAVGHLSPELIETIPQNGLSLNARVRSNLK